MANATQAGKRTPAKRPDAIVLLRSDHKAVTALLAQFAKARSDVRRNAIVQELCLALAVHAQIEKEIFYPAVMQAVGDTQLAEQAAAEHETLSALIAQLQQVDLDGEFSEAKIKAMADYVREHVRHQQTSTFPLARSAGLDMGELGVHLTNRRQELFKQFDQSKGLY